MKNNIYRILNKAILLMCIGALTVSCFKDKSTFDDNSIARYVVAPEKDKSFDLNGIVGENVKINPEVYKILGNDTIRNVDDELNFYWTVAYDPANNDTLREILCYEKNFDMPIPVSPASSKYTLTLNTIDKKYGIHTVTDWKVLITSVYNGGLIIADTKDNGQTSDISLVMAPELSNQLNGEGDIRIFKDIYSINNKGEKLGGTVSKITRSMANYVPQFSFICEDTKSLTRVEPSDFTIIDKNQDRFMIPEDYFAPTYFGLGYFESFLVNNGLLNCFDWQSNANLLFSYPVEADSKGYYCRKYFSHDVYQSYGDFVPRFVIYDELNGRFLKLPGKFEGVKSLIGFNPNNGGAFDLNNVPNKICEMAGSLYNSKRVFMLRDKTTNNLSMYIMSYDVSSSKDNGRLALDVIDMSGFPDINNVISYVMSAKDETIYYATEKKIYAMLLKSGINRVEERYSAPSGTIITAMGMNDGYINYVYKTDIDPETGEVIKKYRMQLNGRVLIYATYDEAKKEGSVTSQYIEELNSGTFSDTYIWRHTGFNKITAIQTVSYQ